MSGARLSSNSFEKVRTAHEAQPVAIHEAVFYPPRGQEIIKDYSRQY